MNLEGDSVCPVCRTWQPFGAQTYMLIDHIENCSKLPTRRNKWLFAVDVSHVRAEEQLDAAIVDGRKSSSTKVRGLSRRTVKLDPFIWCKVSSQPPALIEDPDHLKSLLFNYVSNAGIFVYDVSLLRREWLIKTGTKYRCPNGRLINGNRISTTPKSTFSEAHWREALRMDQSKKGFEIEDDVKELLGELRARSLGGGKSSAYGGVVCLEHCLFCGRSVGNSVDDLVHVFAHFKEALRFPAQHPRWLIPCEQVSQNDTFVGQAYQYPTTHFFRNPLDPNSNVYFRDLDYLGYFLCMLYGTITDSGLSLTKKDRLYLMFVDDGVRQFIYNNGRDAFSNLARHEPKLMADLQKLYPEFTEDNFPINTHSNIQPDLPPNEQRKPSLANSIASASTGLNGQVGGSNTNTRDSDADSWEPLSPRLQGAIEDTVLDVQGQVNRVTMQALLRLLSRTITPQEVAMVVHRQETRNAEVRAWLLNRLDQIKGQMERAAPANNNAGWFHDAKQQQPAQHDGHFRPGANGQGGLHAVQGYENGGLLGGFHDHGKLDFGAVAEVEALMEANMGFGMAVDRQAQQPESNQAQQPFFGNVQQQQHSFRQHENHRGGIMRSFSDGTGGQRFPDSHIQRDFTASKFSGSNAALDGGAMSFLHDRVNVSDTLSLAQMGQTDFSDSGTAGKGLVSTAPVDRSPSNASPTSGSRYLSSVLRNGSSGLRQDGATGLPKSTQRMQQTLPYANPNRFSTGNAGGYQMDSQSAQQQAVRLSPQSELAQLQARHASDFSRDPMGRNMAGSLLQGNVPLQSPASLPQSPPDCFGVYVGQAAAAPYMISGLLHGSTKMPHHLKTEGDPRFQAAVEAMRQL